MSATKPTAGRQHAIQTPGQAPLVPNPESDVLAGIGEDDVLIDISGHQVPMNDIVRSAYETSGISLLEWNDLDGHARDEMVAAKRKEMAVQFRDMGDFPAREEVQRRAQASADARRAARKAGYEDTPEAKIARLPHSSEVDPADLSAPMQCSDGILVPTTPRVMPQNFR